MIVSAPLKNRTAHKAGRVALIILGLITALNASTQAQVNFVHITDPHIFDDVWENAQKPSESEDNLLENRSALAALIGQINDRQLAGNQFHFIAVTGDLGIEALVLELTSRGKTDAEKAAIERALRNDQITDEQRGLIARALQKGARDLASLIALSRVKLWLFVPGNNDVLGELPRHVRYYNEFMKALESSVKELNDTIKVVDLCPHDGTSTGSNYASTSRLYQLDGLRDYAFIGFNDSSFKNGGDLIATNAPVQQIYARQVGNLLQSGDFKYAYVFYHIPEIDDPWIVTQSRTDEPLKSRMTRAALIGNSYFDSAWFVRNEVREEWNRVVMNPRVKGLFAGHFHDPKPQSYQNFDWLRTRNYPAETLSKLQVTPPLALRMQRHNVGHARGFREVFLDKDGSVKSRIIFLTNSQWDFAAGDAATERELALARSYEASGQTTEAAAAYAKAAESNWPPTRTAALASLRQLNDQENTWTSKYLVAPLITGWNAGVHAFGLLLFPIVLALGAIAVSYPFIVDHAKMAGWDKLRINRITDSPNRGLGASFEQLIAQVHSTKAAHYKKRVWFDAPDKVFPMLAGSQSAEVPELLETAVPGILGKVLGWLYKKTDRPRYNLSGTIQTAVGDSSVFVAVSGGSTAKRWRRSGPREELIDHQVIVAHDALDFLLREMNGGRIR